MIFSVSSSLSQYWSKVGEIKCLYNKLRTVYEYLKQNVEKQLLIILPKNYDESKFSNQIELIEENLSNSVLLLPEKIEDAFKLKEKHRVIFPYPVSDWELFQTLVNAGFRDLIIDGSLGFCLPKIKRYYDINIRITPQKSSTKIISDSDPSFFFVRPEDLRIYEPYVDVIDFSESNPELEETYFNIYNRGNFIGEIDQLIPQLKNHKAKNGLIPPHFGTYRLNCEQRCKNPGKHCSVCERTLENAQLIESVMNPLN